MRHFRLLLILCVVAAVIGCAGYKLGPSNQLAAGDRSVQIVPFANQTMEPRLGDALTAALRKELQKDGTYRLATGGPGDIMVSGVITHYYRQPLSFQPNDVVTVQDYQVRLTARVTARERSTGKVLLDRPVNGSTLLVVGSDLTGGSW